MPDPKNAFAMEFKVEEITTRQLHEKCVEIIGRVEVHLERFLVIWKRLGSGRRGLIVPIQEWQLLCYFRGERRAPEATAVRDAQSQGEEWSAGSASGMTTRVEQSSAGIALLPIPVMTVDRFRQSMASVFWGVSTLNSVCILTRDGREVAAVIPPKFLDELKVYLRLRVRRIEESRAAADSLLE